MLLKEIQVYLAAPPVLWCDNISALALASNPVFHARTKHIEVDYHFIREKVLNRDILLKFISTQDQVADLFAKGLSSAQFLFLKSKLLVVPTPINLRGDVKVYQASKRLSASQSRSYRKAESQYGKIFYVPQPSLIASKVTLGVPMSCNPIVCKRKEVQPLAALDNKQKSTIGCLGQQAKDLPLLNVRGFCFSKLY
jgi:hypothetical protein